MHTAHYTGSGSIKLAADVWEGDRNPSVLFLPGGGQTRLAWRRTAGSLAGRGYRVVAMDLRGHGASDWAGDADYSIDAFVADIGAVVAALPVVPVLVGASIGGIAALIAAAETHPCVAQALVLVDVAPAMSEEGLDRIRDFMSAGIRGFATVEEAAEAIARYLPHRRRRAAGGLGNHLRVGADGRYYWHWDPAFHAASRQRSAAGMFARMGRAARSIGIPTLVITGARSEVVSRAAALDLARVIPGAQSIEVAGAGHMVAGDDNEVFAAVVGRFVDGLALCHASNA
jgi:pimeloyl-ACP methyl ester carboxylesterase